MKKFNISIYIALILISLFSFNFDIVKAQLTPTQRSRFIELDAKDFSTLSYSERNEFLQLEGIQYTYLENKMKSGQTLTPAQVKYMNDYMALVGNPEYGKIVQSANGTAKIINPSAPTNTSPNIPVTSKLSTYTPLTPGAFQSITNTDSSKINLSSIGIFLGQLFNYLIAIAAALALIMVIAGGIEYMTTDSWTGKENGKKRIKDALEGLAIALVSWLILYTINPCLVYYTATNGCTYSNTFINAPTTPQTK